MPLPDWEIKGVLFDAGKIYQLTQFIGVSFQKHDGVVDFAGQLVPINCADRGAKAGMPMNTMADEHDGR